MESRQRSVAPLLSSLALLLAGAAPLGCYKPNIQDGGLRCNRDAGAKQCPEGFKCDPVSQFCWRNPDGGADRPEMDRPDGEGPPDVVCADARPACTPGPGLCDPTCQTGCLCGQKCSANSTGLSCNPPRMDGYPKGLGQNCTIESAGLGAQTDNCGPGLVCIEDGCFSRCFAFCKTNADCTNSSCTRDVPGNQKVCDVPFMDACVPLMGVATTGCGPGAMACYLSSADPTHTICDCPLNAKGPNQECTRSRECIPGLACVDRETGENPKCLQVCRLTMGATDCPQPATAASCHAYKGIPAAGSSPHATFGYCF